MVAISPTQQIVQEALGAFLAQVTGLVVGQTIVSGQNNRVPEPQPGDFIVMTPIRFVRVETNLDSSQDCKFTGTIAGALMSVSDVLSGEIEVGANVFGVGVAANTVV